MNQSTMNSMISNISKVTLLALLVFGMSGCKLFKKKTGNTEITDNTPDPVEEVVDAPVETEDIPEEPKEELPERNVVEDITLERRLDGYFEAIATASSVGAANNNIREALTQFSTPSAPVLIIFYKGNGQPSYDEPTTIEKYLNYLKDTKNEPARVDEMVLDDNGKVKELVLTR